MPIEAFDPRKESVSVGVFGVSVAGEAVVRFQLAVPDTVQASKSGTQRSVVVVADALWVGLGDVRAKHGPAARSGPPADLAGLEIGGRAKVHVLAVLVPAEVSIGVLNGPGEQISEAVLDVEVVAVRPLPGLVPLGIAVAEHPQRRLP